jgi:hypothetical protein
MMPPTRHLALMLQILSEVDWSHPTPWRSRRLAGVLLRCLLRRHSTASATASYYGVCRGGGTQKATGVLSP